MTRFNNYSPKTGNRHDYCGITVLGDEMKVFRACGIEEGTQISVEGTINGSDVCLVIQADKDGYDWVRSGNRAKDIFWFYVDRSQIELDGKRIPTDRDDIYVGPLKAVKKGNAVHLISADQTARKPNRKRRLQTEAEVEEDYEDVEVQDEQPLTIAEAKRRLAMTFGVSPDAVKIKIEA